MMLVRPRSCSRGGSSSRTMDLMTGLKGLAPCRTSKMPSSSSSEHKSNTAQSSRSTSRLLTGSVSATISVAALLLRLLLELLVPLPDVVAVALVCCCCCCCALCRAAHRTLRPRKAPCCTCSTCFCVWQQPPQLVLACIGSWEREERWIAGGAVEWCGPPPRGQIV